MQLIRCLICANARVVETVFRSRREPSIIAQGKRSAALGMRPSQPRRPGGCGSNNGMSLGAEVGYGRTFFERVIARGLVGVGDYIATSDSWYQTCTAAFSSCTTTTSHHTSHNIYLQPGILVAITLGPVLVGADASFLYVPSGAPPGGSTSSPFAALMLGVQLGARL